MIDSKDELVDPIDVPNITLYDRALKEKCIKMNNMVSKKVVNGTKLVSKKVVKDTKPKTKITEPLKAIIRLITNTGPLCVSEIYHALDMNPSTCYYRLERLCNEGLLVKDEEKLYTLPGDQAQKEKIKIIFTCKNRAICKYYDQNKCYPEICKYFEEGN